MLYLLGINLPDDKLVRIALKSIYGVGIRTGESICHRLSIHPQCRLKDLPEAKITQLSQLLNTMTIESELRRQTETNIKALVDMGTYRGARHKAGFPVRGQRTRSNGNSASKLNGRFLRARQFST
ncbi:hypothetical protein BC831DRAFT_470875 [Entophlyctis helioformis]|nr:hypothetical protein BC831DRAFT_470875 [Entophlyctis helioformis]